MSGLRGKPYRIGHDDHPAHNGMDAALIGVTTRRKSRDSVGTAGIDRSRVEATGLPLFKTSIMRDRMVSGGWIVPPYRGPTGDRHSGRHIIG
jgi:hypothetical protein